MNKIVSKATKQAMSLDWVSNPMLGEVRTQREWVEGVLEAYGKITCNQALRVYVKRLSAIICDMRAEGWVFKTRHIGVTTVYGNSTDYEYKLVSKPKGT